MEIVVRLLTLDDSDLLAAVAEDVFDEPVRPVWAAEFLADRRHHLAVALADGKIVGFASAVHYIHPDKPPELWINEVGVAPPFQQRGLGKRLLQQLFERGREVGCKAAWVGTEVDNLPARALYRAVGGTEAPEPFVMISFPLKSTATDSQPDRSRGGRAVDG